jgi:hypothetical protein
MEGDMPICSAQDIVLGMAPLQDRAHRLDLSFPVRFCADDEIAEGHCQNISASGLLASFHRPPELWARGQLDLRCGNEEYSLQARVARVEESRAAFAFLFRDDGERAAIHKVMAFALEKTELVGRPF